MKDSGAIDGELWSKIIQDDEKAFNIVFEKYFFSLCKFCHQIVKEVEVTEELVSDVFVRLWLNRHSIQFKSGLKPYLFKSVKNASLNYLRSSRSLVNIEEVNETTLVSDVKSDSGLIHEELNNEILQMINALPPQQGLVFKLHKLEGQSQAEIAETLSISIKTVQNHLCLALKYLSEKCTIYQYDFSIWIIATFSLLI